MERIKDTPNTNANRTYALTRWLKYYTYKNTYKNTYQNTYKNTYRMSSDYCRQFTFLKWWLRVKGHVLHTHTHTFQHFANWILTLFTIVCLCYYYYYEEEGERGEEEKVNKKAIKRTTTKRTTNNNNDNNNNNANKYTLNSLKKMHTEICSHIIL